ncbi:type IX secretion system membrane protein PorP/SprF [Flavobacterium humidisoli]|uniref:Type IX secretion system membrane protein PorP/SprF n=1 Tax=Flavobacterium humidisoli TaxID=2937442 RepID=A0ABY4LXR6_9FLAO|nr:type IX secretion system membrane protein PorP/SprF [Flavobacterium humidisoli]UPZ17871.1 type IX secretion system membrane protein PorP/SprF [Flavobacterium humidisoli]
MKKKIPNIGKIVVKKIYGFCLLISLSAWSQQESQYTQYMYNTLSFNPAYAGSRDCLSIFGLHRNQWVGLEGAPVTNNFSVHSPVGDKVGLGLSVLNDKIGPMDENSISVDFSYTFDLDNFYNVAFGLRGTADFLNVDFNRLNIYNPDDSQLQNNIDNQFSPNVGVGVYAYSDNSYAGFSIPNILETSHYARNSNSAIKSKMHLNFIAGYVFSLNDDFKFKPATLVRAVIGAPIQVNISANFLYRNILTLGAGYRWNSSFSAMAGFQITDGFFAGYAYDAETSQLSYYNAGSHEFFLRFELFKKFNRVINPRFF